MGLAGLVVRYVAGSWLRAGLTVLAVAVCLVAFLLLRTVNAAWTEQVAQTPNNRVVTRHKLGWGKEMPAFYADEIRRMEGVEDAVALLWAGLKLPAAEHVFVDSLAVESRQFVDMHYEVDAPAEQKRAFIADRRGALVSRELAEQFGWKVGDRVHFTSVRGPNVDLTISAIFESTRYGFARRVIWFHLEYFNELMPAENRDRISLIAAKIADPKQGARIAKAIDIHFDGKEERTFSQEDKALNAAMTGRFGAILEAVQLVSLLVLGVVALILGNTIAMNGRERTRQYATLRAIGFSPAHVAVLVLGEALLIGFAGAALAVLIGYPLLENTVSRYLEESMSLSPLVISSRMAGSVLVLGALLGGASGVLPALRLSKREVVQALRFVD